MDIAGRSFVWLNQTAHGDPLPPGKRQRSP
jgi:hypothetical protein